MFSDGLLCFRNTTLEGKRSLTENIQSFLKTLFEVSQDKMALRKGTNQFQVSFQLSGGKGFVKATELEESHLFSYTFDYVTV